MRSAPALRTRLRIAALGLGSWLVLLAAPDARAVPTVVYDNTVNLTADPDFNPGPLEFGDQVTLAGTNRLVTEFQFIYELLGADGDENARVRFYANDGTSGTPGSVLFDTTVPIAGTGVAFTTRTLTSLSVLVPNTFTWTIQFGNTTGDTNLTAIYNPPVVGSSDPSFYWLFSSGQWNMASFGGGEPANFYARVTAEVPEPSTALLLGAGLVTLAQRRRRPGL
jgi:hypothetical protein